MSKTETILARFEPELKHNAETVLAELGLSVTKAVTLFYKQISRSRDYLLMLKHLMT